MMNILSASLILVSIVISASFVDPKPLSSQQQHPDAAAAAASAAVVDDGSPEKMMLSRQLRSPKAKFIRFGRSGMSYYPSSTQFDGPIAEFFDDYEGPAASAGLPLDEFVVEPAANGQMRITNAKRVPQQRFIRFG